MEGLEVPPSDFKNTKPESSSTDLAIKNGSPAGTMAVPDNMSVAAYLGWSIAYAAGNPCRPRLVGGTRCNISASTQRGKLKCEVAVDLFHDGAVISVSATGKVWRGLWWRKGSPNHTFAYYVRCDPGTDRCILVGSFVGQQRITQGSVTVEVRVDQKLENGILQATFAAWAGLLPSSIPDVGFTPVTLGNWPSAKLELPISIGTISWKCESGT